MSRMAPLDAGFDFSICGFGQASGGALCTVCRRASATQGPRRLWEWTQVCSNKRTHRWRARTVCVIDLLVANEGRVIVPCQDRSRRRRWPKASLYKGLSPGHARPTEGDVRMQLAPDAQGRTPLRAKRLVVTKRAYPGSNSVSVKAQGRWKAAWVGRRFYSR
jgi:hypothetical protein